MYKQYTSDPLIPKRMSQFIEQKNDLVRCVFISEILETDILNKY